MYVILSRDDMYFVRYISAFRKNLLKDFPWMSICTVTAKTMIVTHAVNKFPCVS